MRTIREMWPGKGPPMWALAGAIFIVMALSTSQAFSTSFTLSAQPLQNSGPDGAITYSVDWSGASSTVTRHEMSDVNLDASDEVHGLTVDGSKASGAVDVTVTLKDGSGATLDSGSESLPSGSGAYSYYVTMTSGTIAYSTIGMVSVVYSATASSDPVAVDATSSDISSGSSLSWSHTTGTGNNRLLIVGVSQLEGGAISSITYGAASLTFLRADDKANKNRTELWYLVNPASGTNTITVNVTIGDGAVGGAVTFSNVDQTTPFSGDVGAAGKNDARTVTVTSAIDDMVLSVLFIDNGSSVPTGTGQTAEWSLTDNGGFGAGSTQPGATSVTVSWSGTGQFWALSAVNVKNAP